MRRITDTAGIRRAIFCILTVILTLPALSRDRNSGIPDSDSISSLPRPITAVYSIEVGGNRSRATYLSPLTYSGVEFAAAGNWQKVMPFAPDRAFMTFDARAAGYTRLINPGGNALMQGLDLEFYWGMGAYWHLPKSFTAGITGGPEILGGALVQLRNSNNPVNVNIAASLAANPFIAWKGRIRRLPVSAIWSLRLPVAGAFFMPEYGETFYEIYVGNRKGLVHASWPGNHFRMNSMLSLRFDFGKTAMEIGYRFITDNYRANNLSTHRNTHAFSIGVIPYGLGRNKTGKELRPF